MDSMDMTTFKRYVKRHLKIEERAKLRNPRSQRQTIKRVLNVLEELSGNHNVSKLKEDRCILKLGLTSYFGLGITHLAKLIANDGLKFIFSSRSFLKFSLKRDADESILIYLPKRQIPKKVWIKDIRVFAYSSIRSKLYPNGMPDVTIYGLKVFHFCECDFTLRPINAELMFLMNHVDEKSFKGVQYFYKVRNQSAEKRTVDLLEDLKQNFSPLKAIILNIAEYNGLVAHDIF